MRRPLVISTFMLAASMCAANADSSDDYVACLVGRSAVALHSQSDSKLDALALQEIAYAACAEPRDVDEQELEGISDFVNMMVEAMAASFRPAQ